MTANEESSFPPIGEGPEGPALAHAIRAWEMVDMGRRYGESRSRRRAMCWILRSLGSESFADPIARPLVPPWDDPSSTLSVDELLELMAEDLRRDDLETARFVEEENRRRGFLGFITSTG